MGSVSLPTIFANATFGVATKRMLGTVCHKWKVPSTYITQSSFAGFSMPTVSKPGSINPTNTGVVCPSQVAEILVDANGGNDPWAAQIITSFSTWSRTTYLNSSDIQKVYNASIRAQLVNAGAGAYHNTYNVDNSAAGAGVHSRVWFAGKTDCDKFISMNTTTFETSVFRDYRLGEVTLRMKSNVCHKWKLTSGHGLGAVPF